MKKLILIILLFAVSCDVFTADPMVTSSEIKTIAAKVDTAQPVYVVDHEDHKYFVNKEGGIIYHHQETWVFLFLGGVFLVFAFLMGCSFGDNN